jgi:hypothetical protein
MEASLLGFQAAEILDSTILTLCCIIMAVVVGFCAYVAYSKEDDK